jgi:hypothetical protein
MAVNPNICNANTGTPFLRFPDGEVISYAIHNPGSIIPPFVDQSVIDSFLNLNWIMRPPLSDAEIMLMPVAEIIALYYGIRQVKGYGIIPNSAISRGLGRVGVQHELNLQNRIFNLRKDLWQVSDGVKSYRVLLPPNYLGPPSKPKESLLGQIMGWVELLAVPILPLTIYSVIHPDSQIAKYTKLTGSIIIDIGLVGGGGVIGVLLDAGFQTLKAAGTAESVKGIMKAVHASTAVTTEVLAGIDLAKRTVPDPLPDVSLTSALSANYSSWVNSLSSAVKVAPTIHAKALHICDAAYSLIEENGGIVLYSQNWSPFLGYFYSDTVKSMVFPETPLASTTTSVFSDQNAPIAAGIGIGALLLFLA